MIFDEFTGFVTDAYEHLYDLVHLRNQPLIALLTTPETRKERAWQLHNTLLQTIEELDPGTAAPAFSREWRRHRLMVLRYTEGLSAQTVADQLAISRRHYYREHEGAIRAVAEILWNRRITAEAIPDSGTVKIAPPPISVGDILSGALALLHDKLTQKQIEVAYNGADVPIAGDGQLLRQLVLALLGYLADRVADATLEIGLQNHSLLTFALHGDGIPPAERDSPTHDALQKLAALAGVRLELRTTPDHRVTGFNILLQPGAPQPLILIVDDNTDLIELFRRYLEAHHYQTASARSGTEALEIAHTTRPVAILLDLMMPDQDGWDVLQRLRNQPALQHIPVVVCSILPQQELALSLGADAFLQKPIAEDALIDLLSGIVDTSGLNF